MVSKTYSMSPRFVALRACEARDDPFQASGIPLIERRSLGGVDVEHRDQPAPGIEHRDDDLGPRPCVTDDVAVERLDIRDDHCLPAHGGITADALSEGNLHAAERALIGSDAKEATRIGH